MQNLGTSLGAEEAEYPSKNQQKGCTELCRDPYPWQTITAHKLERNSKQPCVLQCAIHCGTAECYQELQ